MPVYSDPFIEIKDLWTQASIKGPASGPKAISLKPGCLDAVFCPKTQNSCHVMLQFQVAAL